MKLQKDLRHKKAEAAQNAAAAALEAAAAAALDAETIRVAAAAAAAALDAADNRRVAAAAALAAAAMPPEEAADAAAATPPVKKPRLIPRQMRVESLSLTPRQAPPQRAASTPPKSPAPKDAPRKKSDGRGITNAKHRIFYNIKTPVPEGRPKSRLEKKALEINRRGKVVSAAAAARGREHQPNIELWVEAKKIVKAKRGVDYLAAKRDTPEWLEVHKERKILQDAAEAASASASSNS